MTFIRNKTAIILALLLFFLLAFGITLIAQDLPQPIDFQTFAFDLEADCLNPGWGCGGVMRL